MTSLISQRLHSHWLLNKRFSTPAEVIDYYWCIQAQDIPQATRVIGSRIPGSTKNTIKKACADWSIVRTWPMRWTLHYMSPKYVHRMLDLCASKTLSWFAKRREFLWISDKYAEKALEIMEKALKGWKCLTRIWLGEALKAWWIPMQTQWVYHLACYAATRKLICFWPPTEKEETFVLLDEWVKKPKEISHEEKLAEIARMYMRSHWPATVDDLARWCGLWKTECRKAVTLIEKELDSIELEGKKYYFVPSDKKLPKQTSSLHLLWWFDEYFLWYKDRSIISDMNHYGRMFTSNGIFFPLILQDGKVIGAWKRQFKKDTVTFTLDILPKMKVDMKELKKKAEEYGKFRWYEKIIIS